MKNATLSFALLLLFSTLLSGQGLNRQYALGHTSIAGGIAAGPESQWLAAGYYGDYGVFPVAIAIDENADEYTIIEISEFLAQPYDEVISVSNVVYDAVDAHYYFALARSGCDYGLTQLLIKIDASDLSVETIGLPYSFYGSHYELAVLPGEGVLLASNYQQELLLFRGNEFYSLFEEDYEPVGKLENLGQDRLLILSESALAVAQVDLSSNTAGVNITMSIDDGLAVASLNDNEILLLQSTGLVLYNTALEVQQQLTFTEPSQLAVDENYVYVLAADGIHFLDHNLAEVAMVPLEELAPHQVLSSAARNGRIVLAGAYQVSDNFDDYSFVKLPADLFIRSFDLEGAELPSDTDLAINAVTHYPVEVVLRSYNCMQAKISGVQVTLSNEGASTIEDVTIALYIEGCGEPVICEAWTAKSRQETINLGPGESLSLQLGDVYTNSIDASDNFGLCLRVFPSGETMETDITNNYSCATPMMVVDTEEAIVPIGFSVYPTICQDQLTLSLPDNSGSFDEAIIYNMLGQTMLKYTLPMGAISFPVDVSQLAVGSYFLRLEGKKRSPLVTFVKN